MTKHYIKALLLLTSAMALAQVSPATPLLNVNIDVPVPVCSPRSCTELFAAYNVPKATTGYTIESMQYGPSFPFTGGTIIPPSAGDDLWSQTVNLPFNFCFYGNSYNQMLVGTNGVITFNLTGWTPGSAGFLYCPWSFNTAIPNTGFPIKNAIYGVYQDSNILSPPVTDPSIQNVNYYVLDVGVNAAPNRVFIANFNELPQYQCNNSVGLQTSQIVLHEGTNIIEVFVKKRTTCATWQGGVGVIGLQNIDGTLATVPPGRNSGTWSTTNEAWRFTPNGTPSTPQLNWFIDGVSVAENTNPLQICPTQEHVYMAMVNYDNCGFVATVTKEYSDHIIADPLPLNDPADILVCANESGSYTADINQNAYLYTGENPGDYLLAYYENEQDAIINAPFYINYTSDAALSDYAFTNNKTIYIRVENIGGGSGCAEVHPFELIINPAVSSPTGQASQNFTSGQTLAALVVEGQDITWYDQATEGNQLPLSTILQDNATYYASQTVNNCESRSINAARLAVTVHVVLANQAFDNRVISVYPNPANDVLNIAFADDLKSVEIYNTLGQKVNAQYPNKKEIRLDISGLQPGVYFVKINTATKQQTVKIIKE